MTFTDKKIDKQAGRNTRQEGQTHRRTNRQTDRQAARQIEKVVTDEKLVVFKLSAKTKLRFDDKMNARVRGQRTKYRISNKTVRQLRQTAKLMKGWNIVPLEEKKEISGRRINHRDSIVNVKHRPTKTILHNSYVIYNNY